LSIPPRRKQTRLPGFDYASEGAYFVTLVTHHRECLFGDVVDDEMVLSEFGRFVVEEWERSAAIRDEIELGAYVVMPNHFHGIVHIFENPSELIITNVMGDQPGTIKIQPVVGAYGHTPQRETKFHSPSHNLGAMVRGYKSAVTTRINALRGTPGTPVWQRNYYDHIIRSDRTYNAVERYIQDNPLRWAEDKENQ